MKYDTQRVINEIMKAPKNTKFYIGCDSRRYRRNKQYYASYATVFVIHLEGKKGCKVFGKIEKEIDYGNLKMRLLNEAYKAVAMYSELEEYLLGSNLEIHMDINSNPSEKSHIAMKEAAGYVLGTTGISPTFKPDAMAASCCADLFECKDLGLNKTALSRLSKKGKTKV